MATFVGGQNLSNVINLSSNIIAASGSVYEVPAGKYAVLHLKGIGGTGYGAHILYILPSGAPDSPNDLSFISNIGSGFTGTEVIGPSQNGGIYLGAGDQALVRIGNGGALQTYWTILEYNIPA